LTAAFLGNAFAGGCKGGDDQTLSSRLNEANDKVVACRKDVNDLKVQNAELKQKLAQAMANPARVQLTDPDVLNLIAEIKGKQGGPMATSCWARGSQSQRGQPRGQARRAGFAEMLRARAQEELGAADAVRPWCDAGDHGEATGVVQTMSLSPHVDNEMTECVRTTVARWKFPPFAGESVVVAQKLTLTPKT
jgi:hypothetical protein